MGQVEPADVAAYVNRHSFVLMALAAWAGLAFLLLRDGLTRRAGLVLALAGLALAGTWLALRPGESTHVAVADVEQAVGRGRPVLVELYSNY
jgi:hypothetical protein